MQCCTSSCIFSIVLFGSIFVFGTKIHDEMSKWRLNKYAGVEIEDLNNEKILLEEVIGIEDITVENTYESQGKYINDGLGHSKTRAQCVDLDEKDIVTKIKLNIQGGYVFDYTTIYWTNDDTDVTSEEHCYKFPINAWEENKTVYIDGHIESIILVPMVFRHGSFE